MENFELRSWVSGEIHCMVGTQGCLGFGGFGVVQCAFHPSIGWVAVKCLPVIGGKTAKEYIVQQIQNELSALQRASHENILRVYGWAQWEGSIAIVTELMPGGNLRPLLGNESVPLQPVLRLRMCKDVSDGTAFIHNVSPTKRLTHGDLKPENILLSSDLHCKVGDFGSARVVKHTGQTTKTTDGSGSKVQVTLVYAAPERLRKLSCRPKKEQDTYSYGMIVHGVLTRETPDQYSASEEKYLDAITRGERPDTEAIDELEESLTTDEEKEIIQELRSVMIRCWQDVPADRPDMRDVRDQLHQLMSKQKQSDVMRSVAQALDKMRIFSPVKSEHRFVPLSCFNSQTRNFEEEFMEPEHRNRNISSSVQLATMASSVDASDVGSTNQLPDMEKFSLSTTAATISSTADASSADANKRPTENQITDCSSTTFATISSAVDASSAGEKVSVNVRSTGQRKSSPKVTRRKPTLKEVFESSDRSKLPKQVKEAPDLLEKYKSCLATGKMEEARALNSAILSIIENEINPKGRELWVFADELKFAERNLESIPAWFASACLFQKKGGAKSLDRMRSCVGGLRWANRKVVGRDVSMKRAVKCHVIPLMRDIKDKMEKVTSVDDVTKCREVVSTLYHIESSEELIGDLEAAEKTYKEGIARMKKTFGKEAEKREKYGRIFVDLGDLYKKMTRFDDATSCYQQVIEVYKAAADFDDEERRKDQIEICEGKLREVQRSVE